MDGQHGKYMAVLYTKPWDCGGHCKYCLRTPGVTRSTRINEDTVLAHTLGWSASAQLEQRISDAGLRLGCGNKYELRIKGNSFTNYPADYLENFIQSALDLLNGEPSETFDAAFEKQADAPDRCVQIVVETRPDQITHEWCQRMRRWGVTTVELGVQSLSDRVLDQNLRGHGTEATRTASRLIRDYGFELGYQVMVGLIGATRSEDERMLGEELWQEDYYPDCLKIYPCIAAPIRLHQLPLYRALERGEWAPYGDEEYLALLHAVLPHIPTDVHVNRVQRILLPTEIKHGPRALIDRSVFDGISACMWQRSVQQRGYQPERIYSDARVEVIRRGEHMCLQAVVDADTIVGYARVRIHDGRAMLRDLRVLGEPRAIGEHNPNGVGTQHVGIGRRLLDRAAVLARENSSSTLDVHCSAGVVRYFEENGFVRVNDRMWRLTIDRECVV